MFTSSAGAAARAAACGGALAVAVTFPLTARALDLPPVASKPLTLEITESSAVVQRFGARGSASPADAGFGGWLNRLNATLAWSHLRVGTRLDASAWWLLPHETNDDPGAQRLTVGDSYRFPQTIYPAKLWASWAAPGVEITAGDAYVQFARGLLVSMRKMDELGIDNTVRGGKIAVVKDPFAATLIAGFANPSRVDEASGQTLFLQRVPRVAPENVDPTSPHPVFGSDRILGAEIQAGRGLPIVLSTSAVRFSRCAPFAARSDVAFATDAPDLATTAFGTCSDDARRLWMASLNDGAASRQATQIDMVAQSVELPKMGRFGNLYATFAIQRRSNDLDPRKNGPESEGNAVVGSYVGGFGPVTSTLEIKSYRNFRPVVASVSAARVNAFAFLSYSTPPTTEALTQDNLGTNDFNACATGGRLRTDVRMSDRVLAYAQGIYEITRSERAGTSCDKNGDVVGQFAKTPELAEDRVLDTTVGIQTQWDRSRSYFHGLFNTRHDVRGDGISYLWQDDVEYTLSLYLGASASKAVRGPASLELTGRHRLRFQADENLTETGAAARWVEGESYAAFKIAPKWVFSAGLEYTTRASLPTWYPNGAVQYKFRSDSSVRVFVGDQRGGLKCVSGVCRIFPPFEGARADLTLRF